MIRMFNDNPGETMNAHANHFSNLLRGVLLPIIKAASAEGMSLRDLKILAMEEVSILCAEEILRNGLASRRKGL